MRHKRWLSTGSLTDSEREFIQGFLENRPWFSFYFQCALEDLSCDRDNRTYWIHPSENGLIMGIHFGAVNCFSTLGVFCTEGANAVLSFSEPAEAHLEREHVEVFQSLSQKRLRRRETIVYYSQPLKRTIDEDLRVRDVVEPDIQEVQRFFETHYPETVFADWMIELPTVGLWQQGELLAVAGTLAVSEGLSCALVGNFLTHPGHRGRGLAKLVWASLQQRLRQKGISRANLGTFGNNQSARSLYETLGFDLIEERPLVYVDARKGAQ